MISFSPEQRILVTGASSGIGKAVALQVNALGATVIASGRSVEKLDAVRACSTHPDAFYCEPRDLLVDMDALPQWIHSLRERHGKWSGLVCAAGTTWTAPVSEFELAKINGILAINFLAPLMLIKGFADRRNNCGRGASIVMIAAASAEIPVSCLSVYAASKGAMVSASKSLSKELAARGIRVNCVSPAVVRTPMGDNYLNMLDEPRRLALEHAYPFGFGEPDDVAAATAYLLSSASRWVTGQNLTLSGGWS